jgi:hypothetical protein
MKPRIVIDYSMGPRLAGETHSAHHLHPRRASLRRICSDHRLPVLCDLCLMQFEADPLIATIVGQVALQALQRSLTFSRCVSAP